MLKRKTTYQHEARNTTDRKFYASKNGWNNATVMVQWLEEIFTPYVGKNKSFLILDSYIAHYCKEVQDYLKRHPNIHLAVIPGGLTPILQPLDFSVNSIFKRYFKESSQNHQIRGVRLNTMQKIRRSKTETRDKVPENNLQMIITDADKERAVKLESNEIIICLGEKRRCTKEEKGRKKH